MEARKAILGVTKELIVVRTDDIDVAINRNPAEAMGTNRTSAEKEMGGGTIEILMAKTLVICT